MYRGGRLLEIARHISLYGGTSNDNKFLMARFDQPSWRKLYIVSERFRERDLYIQSRFHDTMNRKYPSVKAYTKALEKILIGDIEPKMEMKAFSFDEVRPKFKSSSDYRKPPPRRSPPKGYYFDSGMVIRQW